MQKTSEGESLQISSPRKHLVVTWHLVYSGSLQRQIHSLQKVILWVPGEKTSLIAMLEQ